MKKTKILFTLVLLCTSLFISNSFADIKFEQGTWNEIKAKAKKENKLIFMDAFTTWCGPCKMMSKYVFTNDTVADYYNSHFICAKIDMEKGEGIDIAKQYEVQVYPSLLYINGDGLLIHRGAGSKPSKDFIQLGNDAQNPEKQFETQAKKYKNGDRNPAFLKSYIANLKEIYLKTDEALSAYFATQKLEDLSNQDNWEMINTYLSDPNSKEFKYLLKNIDLFAKVNTLEVVNGKIYNVYTNKCISYIRSRNLDSTKYFPCKDEIKKSGFARSEELLLETDMYYYRKNKDFRNYSIVAANFIEKYHFNSSDKNVQILNEVAYEFYKNVKDKAMLSKAEQWAKLAYQLQADPPQVCGDTYACLLFANGKKDEAIKLEKKILEIVKSDTKKYDQSFVQEAEKNINEWSKTVN